MNLQEKYKKEVVPAMTEKFGYKSKMASPRIEKVVVNTGFGKLMTRLTSDEQRKTREMFAGDLALICGQKAVLLKAKKSIASFKLRQGMIIGAKVTLRKKRMYDFLERLINIVLPKIGRASCRERV